MALWPPSFINSDKSSLSASAFKVSDSHCANTDKKPELHKMQKEMEVQNGQ